MKKKFQKSYSLTTESIYLIAIAAKAAKRTPSDFLDVFISEKLGDLKLQKKKKSRCE